MTDNDASKGNHAWEFHAAGSAWEGVQEDEHGNIIGSAVTQTKASDLIRRRRLLRTRNDAAGGRRVVRDMIRYLYIIVDMSQSMAEKDPFLPPGSRFRATVGVMRDFIMEFFDQNPISQIGIIVVRDGEADMLTNLSGNPKLHIQALERLEADPGLIGGQFSLQNGLELAGRSLGHMPRHGSREVVLLVSSLSTCDPGCLIADTLPKLLRANVRFSCIALVAEMYICRKLCEDSSGTMNVCLDKSHFKELLLAQCIPPPKLVDQTREQSKTCDFVYMGFPTRESSDIPSLIHSAKNGNIFGRTSFVCPRCKAKQAELPTDCAVCGLKLVLAPHLARSFHHLFPVSPFSELSESPTLRHMDDSKIVVSSCDCDSVCYGCLRSVGNQKKGDSGDDEFDLRFKCPECKNIFCAECDAYLHETLHNCPGCLCKV